VKETEASNKRISAEMSKMYEEMGKQKINYQEKLSEVNIRESQANEKLKEAMSIKE
jgi:hypothetical protein